MSAEIERAWIAGDEGAGWWDSQKRYWQQELMTPEEALTKEADGGPIINWGVDLVPVEYGDEETGYYLVVRDFDDKVLSCVGRQYTPLQNAELMSFMQAVTKTGAELGISSVLSLKGGKSVAICARRPEAVRIAGEDHLQYMTAANWHDGFRRAFVLFSDVRAVCANTVAAAEAAAPNVFRFRHTGNLEEKVAEAQKVLEMGFAYHDRIAQVGNELALSPMSKSDFEKFLKDLVPVQDTTPKEDVATLMKTRDGIKRVYSDTPDLQNIVGTSWGALQAVVQHQDHERKFHGDGTRMEAILRQDNLNQRAYNLLTA